MVQINSSTSFLLLYVPIPINNLICVSTDVTTLAYIDEMDTWEWLELTGNLIELYMRIPKCAHSIGQYGDGNVERWWTKISLWYAAEKVPIPKLVGVEHYSLRQNLVVNETLCGQKHIPY